MSSVSAVTWRHDPRRAERQQANATVIAAHLRLLCSPDPLCVRASVLYNVLPAANRGGQHPRRGEDSIPRPGRPTTLAAGLPKTVYLDQGIRMGGNRVRITVTWLRLEWRRRWRSLTVLALLVALASATVLTAAAGARRGQTAFDRLWASTLPATATVLPNQPGFNWAKVRALPEVTALTQFPVVFGFALDCCPGASAGFPPADDQMTRTIERPVIFQ